MASYNELTPSELREVLRQAAAEAETPEGQRMLNDFLFNQIVELAFNDPEPTLPSHYGELGQYRIFRHYDSA